MSQIPDFTEKELETIRSKLRQRRGHEDVTLQLADAQILLSKDDCAPTSCPAVFWQVEDCSFVIQKTGEKRYRCQFFYADLHQYGTGIDEYDNIGDCALTLLQIQADHESVRSGAFPGNKEPG